MFYLNPFYFLNFSTGDLNISGSDDANLIFGSLGGDQINGNGGNDLIFGLFGHDKISGGLGDDFLFGGFGKDTIIGNKGDDKMFGGKGDDMLVWNNGDGSDLMHGGKGYDLLQVNFNTDLVEDDLQNKDVAEFSVTDTGIQFARIEVNDQTERGLFQLDVRETEKLETNFGGGDDTAVITGSVLKEVDLHLDGGVGVDLLDLSQATNGVKVNLKTGQLEGSKALNFENVIGSEFDDKISGDRQDNVISGLGGEDKLFGRAGNDTVIGNKGDDKMFGGKGDDMLIWNNGDGSDLMHGGKGYDLLQVNFNTDLVNDDLQNKDVAEFSVTDTGVQFARIEVNDQTERGLFQLDVRQTEELETNFGGGDDTAIIKGNVLDEITLKLDGGAGVDLLDASQSETAISVDLSAGKIGTSTAINFENVTGTDGSDLILGDAQNNVIRGGAGNDVMAGGAGVDTFVFFEEDVGVDVILDFEIGVDQLLFVTSDPNVTPENVLSGLSQSGQDVELALNNKVITFENAQVSDFIDIGTDNILIA